MTPEPDLFAQRARAQTLVVLNQHLVAAVVLQGRMQQSPRNLRGVDFVMLDDQCDCVARLMQTCADIIAVRVADLGGDPDWPVDLRGDDRDEGRAAGGWVDPEAQDLGAEAKGSLDAFAMSVLDAVAVVQANGDAATAELLMQVWREVDRHRLETAAD